MNQDFSNLNMGSGQQPGLTGAEGVFQTQQTTPSTPTQTTGPTSKDSIEKASAIVASLYMPLMSNPLLLPPDPNQAIVISQLALDKICLCILDSWSKNLQEIEEARKADDKKAQLNPILREIHVTAALFLAVATIFIRAIFGTRIAEVFQKNGGLTDEKLVVNKFSSQLAQWAMDGTLKGYLMTIVDKLPSAAHLKEEDKEILAKEIELMLLSSALAALYKASQQGPMNSQWITHEEFIHLLANPNALNDPHAAVLSMLIVNVLSDLPEDARLRMSRTISLYMDSNPDLPTLFDLGQSTEIQLSILNANQG